MKLLLSPNEIHTVLYNAFVDGGLNQLRYSSCDFNYRDEDYDAAVKKLTSPCLEDIWLQILKDGKALYFQEMEEDGQPIQELTLEKAIENLKLPEAIPYIVESLDKNGKADALTHYNILQFILFKELKYS